MTFVKMGKRGNRKKFVKEALSQRFVGRHTKGKFLESVGGII